MRFNLEGKIAVGKKFILGLNKAGKICIVAQIPNGDRSTWDNPKPNKGLAIFLSNPQYLDGYYKYVEFAVVFGGCDTFFAITREDREVVILTTIWRLSDIKIQRTGIRVSQFWKDRSFLFGIECGTKKLVQIWAMSKENILPDRFPHSKLNEFGGVRQICGSEWYCFILTNNGKVRMWNKSKNTLKTIGTNVSPIDNVLRIKSMCNGGAFFLSKDSVCRLSSKEIRRLLRADIPKAMVTQVSCEGDNSSFALAVLTQGYETDDIELWRGQNLWACSIHTDFCGDWEGSLPFPRGYANPVVKDKFCICINAQKNCAEFFAFQMKGTVWYLNERSLKLVKSFELSGISQFINLDDLDLDLKERVKFSNQYTANNKLGFGVKYKKDEIDASQEIMHVPTSFFHL